MKKTTNWANIGWIILIFFLSDLVSKMFGNLLFRRKPQSFPAVEELKKEPEKVKFAVPQDPEIDIDTEVERRFQQRLFELDELKDDNYEKSEL